MVNNPSNKAQFLGGVGIGVVPLDSHYHTLMLSYVVVLCTGYSITVPNNLSLHPRQNKLGFMPEEIASGKKKSDGESDPST